MPIDPALESHFTDELKADPVVSQFYEKGDYKSVPDVMKGLAHSQKRLGSVVPLLNGDSKPEDIENWRKEHLPKLVSAKLIDAPRQLPEKYELAKPEGLPEGAWNDGLEAEVHQWAKESGLSQEQLAKGFGLYLKSFAGAGQAINVNRQQSAETVKKWTDQNGVSVEEFDSALQRFRDNPLNNFDDATREQLSASGLADYPLAAIAMYKIVKDSGLMDTRNDTGATDIVAVDAQKEINDIRNNPENPRHAKYLAGDIEAAAYMSELYKKLPKGTKFSPTA